MVSTEDVMRTGRRVRAPNSEFRWRSQLDRIGETKVSSKRQVGENQTWVLGESM